MVGAESYRVDEIVFVGQKRSRQSWLEEFLGLKPPFFVSSGDLFDIQKKLLTSGVFRNVTVSLKQDETKPDSYRIVVDLVEKWTTIPVFRGQFGGGTLLKVIGGYDIHGFGRLWTIGAETRRYDNAPLGYVAWAQAPRWRQGKHVLGFEYWRQFRKRTIYNDDQEKIGTLNTDRVRGRSLFMLPLGKTSTIGEGSHWQWGFDLNVIDEYPASYVDDQQQKTPPEMSLSFQKETHMSLLPSFVYDNITRDNFDYDGMRFISRFGMNSSGEETYERAILEYFYYKLFGRQFNLASHLYMSHSASDHVSGQTFLGAFDSLRGFPDGAIYGSKAAYGNFEAREIGFRFKHLWLQNVVFFDWGSAAPEWGQIYERQQYASGVGLRMAFPSVYRLMLRVDYAIDLQHPERGGVFSAGLNQLFQPYRPL